MGGFMNNNKICPPCGAVECAGCENGKCIFLTDNNFGEKGCPFFKTKEQAQKEKDYCQQRLANIKKGIMEG
jgi:hypothetical protein